MDDEYIFFSAALRDRFLAFAAGHGIACAQRADDMEDGFVVAVPDDLSDEIAAALEAEYDALMDAERAQVEEEEGEAGRDLMGVAVVLPDGRHCTVRLPAALGRRLYEHFASDEIHELVNAIAAEVADPLDGPVCRGR